MASAPSKDTCTPMIQLHSYPDLIDAGNTETQAETFQVVPAGTSEMADSQRCNKVSFLCVRGSTSRNTSIAEVS